jgi:putative FmdB family regulatory protein
LIILEQGEQFYTMPIYEYACTACDHKLEILQKMSDAPLEQCPACNQNTLKKLVSASGFRLKGTGWYETDFKGKKKAEPEKKTESVKKEDNAKTESVKKEDTVKTKKTDSTSTPT